MDFCLKSKTPEIPRPRTVTSRCRNDRKRLVPHTRIPRIARQYRTAGHSRHRRLTRRQTGKSHVSDQQFRTSPLPRQSDSAASQPRFGQAARRPLLIALGLLCTALAALGLILPGLPTTPFLLLATACFARSSPALHARLLHSRLFGPPPATLETTSLYHTVRPLDRCSLRHRRRLRQPAARQPRHMAENNRHSRRRDRAHRRLPTARQTRQIKPGKLTP